MLCPAAIAFVPLVLPPSCVLRWLVFPCLFVQVVRSQPGFVLVLVLQLFDLAVHLGWPGLVVCLGFGSMFSVLRWCWSTLQCFTVLGVEFTGDLGFAFHHV